MPSRRIILAIAGAALLCGLVISGCNRNRDTRSASSTRRPVKNTRKQNRDLAQAPSVRPAEVLAASVKRPQPRRRAVAPTARPVQQMQPVQPMYQDYYQQSAPAVYAQSPSYELAQAYEPLPEPVPVSALSSYGQTDSYVQTASYTQPATYDYYQTTYAQPTYSQPTYQAQQSFGPIYDVYTDPTPAYEPVQVYQPSPELAMARASLVPVVAPLPAPEYVPQTQPSSFVPLVEPQPFHAPIPELEPVRYQRVAAQQPASSPLMSGPIPQFRSEAAPANRDIRRALEPLAQPAAPMQGWVPSPATAMGGGRSFY